MKAEKRCWKQKRKERGSVNDDGKVVEDVAGHVVYTSFKEYEKIIRMIRCWPDGICFAKDQNNIKNPNPVSQYIQLYPLSSWNNPYS
jgi:hypothetical protein